MVCSSSPGSRNSLLMRSRTFLKRRLGAALYTTREAPAAPRTRRAAMSDLAFRPLNASGRSTQGHLAAAIDWLTRAQDMCRGGVSYGYDLRRGWMAAYPETTGYIIPTLFDY